LFQLVRDYKFTITKRRKWRKDLVTSNDVREFTFHYDMLVEDDPDDPACPCDDDIKKDSSEFVGLTLGRLGIRIDAFWDTNGHLVFRLGQQAYRIEPASLKHASASVQLRGVPDLIRHLSGIEADDLTATAELEREFDRTDLWIDRLSGWMRPADPPSSTDQGATETP
jgi:hypothetical protein